MAEKTKDDPHLLEFLKNPWSQFGTPENKPMVCVIIGMAGSGKTTFLQRLNATIVQNQIPSYIVNLDPAVSYLPFGANIDIRDSVNYKQVMKQYNLGPNGGIITSLNLFSTQIDKVLTFIEKRSQNLKYVFVDTPGQIEVFNWSASGTIITEALSFAFPTCFVYVIDTPRCTNPTTFMSNMLYACSMLYKTKLPLIVVFNKSDVIDPEFAKEWMTDTEQFEDALRSHTTFQSDLTRSMSLLLEEFYSGLNTVSCSAMTGAGIEDFFSAVHRAAYEYKTVFKPDLEKKIESRKKMQEDKNQNEFLKFKQDLIDNEGKTVAIDLEGLKIVDPSPEDIQAESEKDNE
eukprot:TRINITY_DN4219_c0_g1_i1.p1 TRINITY_DN4219_c0_g1~~TRINITY_DN4219_c0_g1_i1.p1  ORF type:complete len:358 (+),score=81.49 TRINITY_DN4219_c0_g1_i1:45-1076(+)